MDGIYIINDIGEKAPPVRFAVELDGVRYKLFSYFPVGSGEDQSLAVHTYFRSTHTSSKKFDTSPVDLPPDEAVIQVSEAEKLAVPYSVQKYTFHQSGIINAKDRQGDRIREERDTRSIPFRKIVETVRLCYIYPTFYTRYPCVEGGSNDHHNVFRLAGAAQTMPPIIEMRACRRNFDLVERLKVAYAGFLAFVDRNTLIQAELELYTVFRESENSEFVRAEAFFRDVY